MSATKSAWEKAIYMIPDISVTEARSPVLEVKLRKDPILTEGQPVRFEIMSCVCPLNTPHTGRV